MAHDIFDSWKLGAISGSLVGCLYVEGDTGEVSYPPRFVPFLLQDEDKQLQVEMAYGAFDFTI